MAYLKVAVFGGSSIMLILELPYLPELLHVGCQYRHKHTYRNAFREIDSLQPVLTAINSVCITVCNICMGVSVCVCVFIMGTMQCKEL